MHLCTSPHPLSVLSGPYSCAASSTANRTGMSACCRVLTLLTWRIGCLLLCGASALVGSFPFVAPFAELPLTQREIVLQSWATSSIASFRKVYSQSKFAVDTTACGIFNVHNAVWLRVCDTIAVCTARQDAIALTEWPPGLCLVFNRCARLLIKGLQLSCDHQHVFQNDCTHRHEQGDLIQRMMLQAFTALKGLIMAVVLTSLDDTHTNPLWPAMGYPGSTPFWTHRHHAYIGLPSA